MNKCLFCKWQYSCPDNWEDNPKIPETGCIKFEREDKNETKRV